MEWQFRSGLPMRSFPERVKHSPLLQIGYESSNDHYRVLLCISRGVKNAENIVITRFPV